MYQIKFDNPCRVHFIGIGGISMSGLAEILLDEHFTVSGSDMKESALTKRLEDLGATVFYGQKAENIPADTDVVIATAAIHPDNPEYAGAVARHLPMLTRADLLGQVMAHYHHAINIAGTHGKTTTTSLVSEIFLEAGLDPTISVGGILPSIHGNVRIGGPDYFIAEACEYTNSFLSFFPTAEVILNVEADHLDFFKDIDDIRHSFGKFIDLLPDNGILVIHSNIDHLEELKSHAKGKVVTFGEGGDYAAENISYNTMAYPTFTVLENGTVLGEVSLHVPGAHNVDNALAAIALARSYGVSFADIQKGIAAFDGTKRRFEKKGEKNGCIIIDDYAHHPQEITATLKAAEKCPHKRIRCIFQPHTYTRTKAFLDDFAAALSLADEVIMAKIFPARETDTLGISSDDVRKRIEALGTRAVYIDTFEGIQSYIQKTAEPGDLILTMGAGDVYKIGETLLKD